MKPPYSYILIAEDDIDDQQLIRERLALYTSSVVFECVNDGLEAIQFLRQCPANHCPAVILLDYKMPKFSAPEVLATIKNDERYRNVPKIVWSTSRNPVDMERCLQSGADKYLFKPYELHGIDEIVAHLMSLCSQSRTLANARQ